MARSAAALALACLACAACGRSGGEKKAGATERSPDGSAEAPAQGPPLAGNDFYRVDVAAPPACSAGQTCEAKLRLTALGAYHVNDDGYPFKFVADVSPGLSVEKDGSFAQKSAKVGELTVTFRADAAGTAQLAGVFKLSVCSDADCQIEEPKIAFAVPVH